MDRNLFPVHPTWPEPFQPVPEVSYSSMFPNLQILKWKWDINDEIRPKHLPSLSSFDLWRLFLQANLANIKQSATNTIVVGKRSGIISLFLLETCWSSEECSIQKFLSDLWNISFREKATTKKNIINSLRSRVTRGTSCVKIH